MSRKRLRMTVSTTIDVKYLIYPPGDTSEAAGGKHPVLLFLHGAGERGSDLNQVKRHGPPKQIESGQRLPFWVVAPQCPSGVWWPLEPLEVLLKHVLKTCKADASRVYLTGLSMGGYGTWALTDRLPHRFAAIAPICGPFTWVNPENFKSTPTWCFHGAMDDVVPVQDSIRMVRNLRAAGGEARLSLYPDAGHDSWTETYGNPALYAWLLAHRRR